MVGLAVQKTGGRGGRRGRDLSPPAVEPVVAASQPARDRRSVAGIDGVTQDGLGHAVENDQEEPGPALGRAGSSAPVPAPRPPPAADDVAHRVHRIAHREPAENGDDDGGDDEHTRGVPPPMDLHPRQELQRRPHRRHLHGQPEGEGDGGPDPVGKPPQWRLHEPGDGEDDESGGRDGPQLRGRHPVHDRDPDPEPDDRPREGRERLGEVCDVGPVAARWCRCRGRGCAGQRRCRRRGSCRRGSCRRGRGSRRLARARGLGHPASVPPTSAARCRSSRCAGGLGTHAWLHRPAAQPRSRISSG